MMQLNEFAEEILASVREKANGDFSVWTTTVHKNNGTSFVGISISGTENQAQPIVYLDGYYNMFLHSKISLKEVSDPLYFSFSHVVVFSKQHLNYCYWNQNPSK